jgi:ribosome-binding protein aMBF1 (putative translation factor)
VVQRDGIIVKLARELRGWTQVKLAEEIGVREPTVRRMERGDATVKVTTWARTADKLGLGFDWKNQKIVPEGKVPEEAIDAALRERLNGDGGSSGLEPFAEAS